MKIEKIRAVKYDFYEGSGPAEIIALGFKVDKKAYILGTFYFGPGMNKEITKDYDELEHFIDQVIKLQDSPE